MIDKLSQKSGADFDREFVAQMVKDHRKDVSAFEREARHGKDPAVRDFAAQILPTLREHLQIAEKLE